MMIRPPYMDRYNRKDCTNIFNTRARMLDVKDNYKGKHRTLTCRWCNKTQDTQQHILENCPGFRTTTAHTPYNMYFNDKENATDQIKEILQKVITQINNMTQEETNQEST